MILLESGLLDRKANANATEDTTAGAMAGPSTAPFARCPNDFAQDDNFFW
jgi:hypothetical protein